MAWCQPDRSPFRSLTMRKNSTQGLFPFIASPGTGKTVSPISFQEDASEGCRVGNAGRASMFISLESCAHLGSMCFCYMLPISNKFCYF